MAKGFVSIVLHAHLPFVKHPEFDDFLEEDWYFEAATETYLPLLSMMDRLVQDKIPFALNMVITPTLAGMMEDPHHKARLLRYLRRGLELARHEAKRLERDEGLGPVARFYEDRLSSLLHLYEDVYRCDLIAQFRRHAELGHLEIMTCAATHGLLPVLRVNEKSVRAQVQVGVEEFQRHFHHSPKGIWLPECGYYEGVEEILAEHDLRYFIVDTHCLARARPTPVFGVYAPVFTPSGVAVFGRDPESSKQVWSAKEGYPGDVYYREFYRDQGYELPEEQVRPFILPTGHRRPTGLKFYRITGDVDLAQKKPYMRGVALERAQVHAGNFMFNRERQIEYLESRFGRPPIVVAPYDAELFGHWWFEGPDFLDFLFRKSAREQNVFEFATLSSYLRRFPTQQVAVPGTGSWGDKGYFEVWLNDATDYIYPHLFWCGQKMCELANRFRDAQDVIERALNQCARELLLLQSSDWPFIITTRTMAEYAHKRIRDHYLRFAKLAQQIEHQEVDVSYLKWLEYCDSVFPEIDFRVYGS